MTLKHWAWMTGLVAALAATSGHAQQRGAGDVYLGAALGYNMAPDAEEEAQRETDLAVGAGSVDVSIEDAVFGWGAYAGYFVADILALEAGYLGNADMEVEVEALGERLTGDWSTSALYAAAAAYIPVPEDSAAFPFVKAGFARWDAEISFDLGEGVSISDDEDGTDLLLGGGIDVPLNESVSIRGEYMLLLLDDEDGGSHHRFQVGVNFAL